MTIKEEIEATIEAYKKACLPENINKEYYIKNNLIRGICYFSTINEFWKLNGLIKYEIRNSWLCKIPNYYFINLSYEKIDIVMINHIRIEFLKDLLKKI